MLVCDSAVRARVGYSKLPLPCKLPLTTSSSKITVLKTSCPRTVQYVVSAVPYRRGQSYPGTKLVMLRYMPMPTVQYGTIGDTQAFLATTCCKMLNGVRTSPNP